MSFYIHRPSLILAVASREKKKEGDRDVVLATALAFRLGRRSGDPRRGRTSRGYSVRPWLGRNLYAGKTLVSPISIANSNTVFSVYYIFLSFHRITIQFNRNFNWLHINFNIPSSKFWNWGYLSLRLIFTQSVYNTESSCCGICRWMKCLLQLQRQ